MSESKPSSRPVWTGAISFGLVSIPIRLYTAIREKRLHFRTLHDQDKVPLKQKLVCPAHGDKEVHREHTVKGFEIEKDRFVVIQESELEAAAPKGGKAIEIQDFVELSQIDPLFFDRPYHIVPKPEGAKPFKLLLEAMNQTKRVAIAKVVLWGKENLAALRPLDDGMVLETMHFSDEVVAAASVPGHEVHAKVESRELKMALSLVESLTADFDPSRYHDDYREKVLALIARKAEGEEIVTTPTTDEKAPRNGHDLMAALEASLAAAKGEGRSNGSANGNGPGHAAHACRTAARARGASQEVGMSSAAAADTVKIGKRELRFSNLTKVLYPKSRFTKGDVLDYYQQIAPTMLPHLKGRALTLKRYPNGVDALFFYEKRCPAHRPDWVKTASVPSNRQEDTIDYCTATEEATIAWMANLASLEIHPLLSKATNPQRPTAMVFDLDPGPPAGLLDCVDIALRMHDLLTSLGLESFPKTSGGKGIHLWVPLNTPVTFDQTKPFAHSLALLLEKQTPDKATATMRKDFRGGKIFIDWSQNDSHKTTVAPYSLRAREEPTVSTPVTWDELKKAAAKQDASSLVFRTGDVLKRVKKMGDLFEPVLKLKQKLPKLNGKIAEQ